MNVRKRRILKIPIICVVLLFLGPSLDFSVAQTKPELVPYKWVTEEIGRYYCIINVPPGFAVMQWRYMEGIVTTLSYKNGSSFRLHCGGMMAIPFHQFREDVVTYSTENSLRVYRRGYNRRTHLRWGEINYKGQYAFYNFSYSDVPRPKAALFDKCLQDFKIK
jgi:hypothetical protein